MPFDCFADARNDTRLSPCIIFSSLRASPHNNTKTSSHPRQQTKNTARFKASKNLIIAALQQLIDAALIATIRKHARRLGWVRIARRLLELDNTNKREAAQRAQKVVWVGRAVQNLIQTQKLAMTRQQTIARGRKGRGAQQRSERAALRRQRERVRAAPILTDNLETLRRLPAMRPQGGL